MIPLRFKRTDKALVLLLVLLFCTAATGQEAGTAKSLVEAVVRPTTVKWRGYEKKVFSFEKQRAFVVAPKVAAAGNPWIWRTSFPDFHAEVDEELLHCGFHVAFIDVVQMLGSDSSLDIMDSFYEHVRHRWQLAERPALEPCSRGGLHAYRFAARHPDRIACIFGDVPVMDLKSWPMGWPDAKKQVSDALRFYGFASQEELLQFRGNPIDLLEPIAKARIPLRHAICLNDQVVPPEQNTLEARRRLRALGHDLDLVVVEASDRLHGHHFDMPRVMESVGFVLRHASVLPKKQPLEKAHANGELHNEDYFVLRNGLANCRTVFAENKRGRVVFLGGSITHGSGWRDEVMRYLRLRFPETDFDFVEAGIPSVGSNGHAFRIERDVLSQGPVDLVFVEAAVNDGSNIPDQPNTMRRAMEGVVRHLRRDNPMTDIVHLHFAMQPQLEDYQAGHVPTPIREHELAAEHYGCTTVNITREVADRIAAGQFTWASGFRSNVHPPPFGHTLYANSIKRMLEAAFELDASAKPHHLPDRLVDPASYVRGRFGNLEDAKLGDGFSLVPEWMPEKGRTREGFAGVSALVADAAGAKFTYAFDGTAIGLFLAAGYDSGVIKYQIDGGEIKTVDTATRWSKGLHLPWPMILADGLAPGKHTLTVETTDQAAGRTALHVIHILEN